MSKSIYSRLTRKRRGIAGFTQLWLAPDHLLLVTNSRFNERYQRFLLTDIQAIVISERPSVGALQLGGAALALLWTMLFFAVDSIFAKGFFLLTGAFFLTLVAVDFLRGPRCRCTLQTEVSRTPLPPLARTRQAARFLSLITPVVEGAQGRLSPESIASFGEPSPAAFTFDKSAEGTFDRPGGAPITLFGTVVNAPVVNFAKVPPALPEDRTNIAWILFSLLLLTGPLVWAALVHSRQALGLLPTAYMAEFVLTLLVLIRGRANPARLTYLLAIVSAIFFCIDISTVSGVAGWSALLRMARQAQSSGAVRYGWLSETDALVFAVGWRFTLGVLGLTAWFSESGGAWRKLKSL